MAKKNTGRELTGKARLRAEIVEAMQYLHKIGAVSDADLEQTTQRMLRKDALPKGPPHAT